MKYILQLLLDPFIKFNINENNELSIFKKGKDKLEKLNQKRFYQFYTLYISRNY